MLAVLTVLGALAALAQLGVLPLLFLDPLTQPLLPVALVAGWCLVRGPAEAWPTLLLAPALLGVLSEERVGWFVLALLPTAAVAVALLYFARNAVVRAPRRLASAACAGAVGAACHASVLALASGRPLLLVDAVAGLALAVCVTAALSALVAAAVWRTRPRARGLFG
ncbi:MAG: hypothetical protein GEU80_08470 [Dehalococcoidia bacterium]|nr:hypothetical protein [Dehalococcoidia bacterium]